MKIYQCNVFPVQAKGKGQARGEGSYPKCKTQKLFSPKLKSRVLAGMAPKQANQKEQEKQLKQEKQKEQEQEMKKEQEQEKQHVNRSEHLDTRTENMISHEECPLIVVGRRN